HLGGDLEFRHALLSHCRLPFPVSFMSSGARGSLAPGTGSPPYHSAADESLYKKAVRGAAIGVVPAARSHDGQPAWTPGNPPTRRVPSRFGSKRPAVEGVAHLSLAMTNPVLALLCDPRLSPHVTSAVPAWLCSIEPPRMVWTNAAGAGL